MSILKIITVTQLNKKIKTLLHKKIGCVLISGEISNFSKSSSGHWYFNIKDENSQIKCIMFHQKNYLIKFIPKDGEKIILKANISLYIPKGDYQLIIETLKKIGFGELQQKFENLKNSLKKEGIFQKHHKKKLPKITKKLGIITSINGAALYDILKILKRRDPLLPVVIYHTSVQGKKSINQISKAINLANFRNECDVLIISRGGGSQEDLDSFNNEKVVRSIFLSKIPIVSAIGHETNITISDFVSDVKTPTPSSAAEIVSRNFFELIKKINLYKQRLEISIDFFLEKKKKIYNQKKNFLLHQHPKLYITKQKTILIILINKIQKIMYMMIQKYTKKFAVIQNHFSSFLKLKKKIFSGKKNIQKQYYLLNKYFLFHINFKKMKFLKIYSNLKNTNPLKIILRGFSITSKKNKTIIKKIQQVKKNENIFTKISNGIIISKIIKIKKNNVF